MAIGDKGRLEMEIAVNLPDDRPTRLLVTTGTLAVDQTVEVIEALFRAKDSGRWEKP